MFRSITEGSTADASLATSEARLVQQLKRRHPAAWSLVYESHHAKIFRFAWSSLQSQSEADDLAAAVFDRALAGIDSYSYQGKPLVAWLFGIAKNLLREQRRQARRENAGGAITSLPLDAATETALAGSEDDVVRRLDLGAALQSLTKRQQEVISLIYLYGFSAGEAAAITGKTERAVYYLEARALAGLRAKLEQRR